MCEALRAIARQEGVTERLSSRLLDEHFERADVDHNARISRDEFVAYHARFVCDMRSLSRAPPPAKTSRFRRSSPAVVEADGRRDPRVDDDLLLRPLLPLLHREEHVGRLHGEREVVRSQASRRRRNADLAPIDGRPRPGDIQVRGRGRRHHS